METIRIRGLSRLAAGLLGLWGAIVALKGLWDVFAGEPEANLYAPHPWAFVTQVEWLRWSGFELSYGLACLGLAWYCLRWGAGLPETLQRRRREPDFELFR
jgi:hypothetical protein